jgi:hypothetical protein
MARGICVPSNIKVAYQSKPLIGSPPKPLYSTGTIFSVGESLAEPSKS